MNDDRTELLLREALHERAELLTPGDRLEDILERAEGRSRRWRLSTWVLPGLAAAVVLVLVLFIRQHDAGEGVRPGADPVRSAGPTHTESRAALRYPLPVYVLGANGGEDHTVLRLYRGYLPAPRDTGASDPERVAAAVRLAMTTPPSRFGVEGPTDWWKGVSVTRATVSAAGIELVLSGGGRPAATRPQDAHLAVAQLGWTAQAVVGRGNLPVRFATEDGSRVLLGVVPTSTVFTRPPTTRQFTQLADIWITGPGDVPTAHADVWARRDILVTGEACVPEAGLGWEVLDGSGTTVASGHVTASRGAPDRGTWSVRTAGLAPGDYVFRVFAQSQQDGQGRTASAQLRLTAR